LLTKRLSKATLVVDHLDEGTKFGRYALLDKIGVGGMAEIYRAKTFGAAGFEKEFAIKLILPSLVDDEEFVEMFINEAKIAVSLYHANIVQVFDLGEIDAQYYIAMEYVLGKDLLEMLARCAERNLKIPLNLVLFITMEMLKGLNFAHRAKDPFGEDLDIIHRDVSPSNIMISYAGDVKVGDFGVAKAAIERTLTESGTLKGKVGYMSPEQVMGDEIDARSDVFAAGVVFFEALSMSRLFVGSSDLEVMLQVRDADIEASLEKAQPLPQGLLSIVERALTKHREERFQTSGEFYQALVDFSYQYSIKVTGTDLSNFMRRLFADEIEEEKSRRLAEPKLNKIMSDVPSESKKKKPALQNTPPEAKDKARQMAENVPLSEAEESVVSGTHASPDADATREASDQPTYRYRESSGLIYGPMGFETLTGLLGEQDQIDGDMVSIGDGGWQELDEIEELDEHLPDPQAAPDPQAKPDPQAEPEDPADTDEDPAGDDDSPDGGDKAPMASADTLRAQVPDEDEQVSDEDEEETDEDEQDEPGEIGRETTTLPEENDLARELEAAVSSLEDLSRGLDEATAREPEDAIPFEISSLSFSDSAGIDEHSAVDQAPPDAPQSDEDLITSEDMSANPAIAELRNQYASYEGELSKVPFARILGRLHGSNATGRLFVRDGSVEKSIFMRAGEPVMVDSNKKDELLGSFLLDRGRITQAQLDEALARLSEWGGRLGDALVAIGAIQAHDIFELLGEQMRQKLLDVFNWRSGHYGYYENQEPDTVGYPLGLDTYSTIAQACRDNIPLDLIEDFYAGREHVGIYKVEDPPLDVDLLKLSARELRIITELDAGCTLHSILDENEDDRRELLLRTVYLLHQVEVLKLATTDKLELPGQ
jgi:serine/threonine protein kinase